MSDSSPVPATSSAIRVAGVWLVTRLLVLVSAAIGAWGAVEQLGLSGYVAAWRQWDTKWFESIAVYGYVGPYVNDFENYAYNVAFFPAYPLLIRLGMAVGLSAVLAGMLISLAASLVASFGLARFVRDMGGRPELAALAWLIAPTAVFLTAAYTEALFMAFAVWSWVLARRGSWMWAGVLAAGAALVRPNGMFLGIALVVMFVLSRPQRWLRGLWLLLPFLATLGYFAYLRAITGSWNAWNAAQHDYWQRSFVDPVTSLVNTYRLIFTFSPTGEPSSRLVTEILAMAVLVALIVVLGLRRWWPEFTYALVTAVSLGTSTMYHSVPRTLVVVFPLWVLIGLWLGRRRWRPWAYAIVCAPALVIVTMRFVQGQWIS